MSFANNTTFNEKQPLELNNDTSEQENTTTEKPTICHPNNLTKSLSNWSLVAVNKDHHHIKADIEINPGIKTRMSCHNILHMNIKVQIDNDTTFNIKQIYRTSCPDDNIDQLENTQVSDEHIFGGSLDIKNICLSPGKVDFYIDDWHFYIDHMLDIN